MDLTDFGWKRTASGRYSHPDISAGAGRVRLFTETEARREQRAMDARLDYEFMKGIREALTREITTAEQVQQRINLLNALGNPFAALLVRAKYAELLGE